MGDVRDDLVAGLRQRFVECRLVRLAEVVVEAEDGNLLRVGEVLLDELDPYLGLDGVRRNAAFRPREVCRVTPCRESGADQRLRHAGIRVQLARTGDVRRT